jgi:hypothetical protein
MEGLIKEDLLRLKKELDDDDNDESSDVKSFNKAPH